MRKILEYLDQIDLEICGAKEYAEKYIELKAAGNMTWAERFKKMSDDKLKSLVWLHEFTISEIEQIKRVYTPPTDMQDVWNAALAKYVEKSALIKQMLSM